MANAIVKKAAPAAPAASAATTTAPNIADACATLYSVCTLALAIRDMVNENEDLDGIPLGEGIRAVAEKAGYLTERAISMLGERPMLCGGDYNWWASEAEPKIDAEPQAEGGAA